VLQLPKPPSQIDELDDRQLEDPPFDPEGVHWPRAPGRKTTTTTNAISAVRMFTIPGGVGLGARVLLAEVAHRRAGREQNRKCS